MREITRRTCAEINVTIGNSALFCDHVHMFADISPHIQVSDFGSHTQGALVTLARAGISESTTGDSDSVKRILINHFREYP